MRCAGSFRKFRRWKFILENSRSIKRLSYLGIIALLLFAAPGLSMAGKRVGIVYSEASADKWWAAADDDSIARGEKKFAYSQLFMSMQHQAMMAGIPFDVLSEADLIGISDYSEYSALILLPMAYATDATAVATALQAASRNGVGLIGGGLIISLEVMQPLFGIRSITYRSGVPATITAVKNDDMTSLVMKNYDDGEEIRQYDTIWLNYYEINTEDTDLQASATLADVTAGISETVYLDLGDNSGELTPMTTVTEETYGAAFATEKGGRNIYFINDQIMADTNLVWQALRWVVYGDDTPVALKMGRSDSIFVSRNDMDSSMYSDELDATVVPLLDLLKTWKERYNFVGSYYINIGNDPSNEIYTDWNKSGPLYRNYIALGNEIGTHSYTHPDYTSTLTSEELKFEFYDSMLEIEAGLGTQVTGAAIPGNAETLEVDWELNNYFEYISGRWSSLGAGYPGAFGYLTPDYDMLYFSLNMLPDYTLIVWQQNTPAQATQIWAEQYTDLLKHASQPIMHWLWHDYGPTSGVSSVPPYTVEMFENTIALAYNKGSEFATADDIQKRIVALQAADLEASGSNTVTVDLTAQNVGQFSLELDSDSTITAVENWYAYDDDQVFIPQTGGHFVIHQGGEQSQVTRIVSLPMRAKLISTAGDGTALSFVLEGEGTVSVELAPDLLNGYSATGADSTVLSENILEMKFNQAGTHTANITVDQAPTADAQSVSTTIGKSVSITLSGSDPDGDTITMRVVSNPSHGRLSGTAPNLTYTPNFLYSGSDSFTFVVNDGKQDSLPATVSISIKASLFGGGCGY